MGSFGEINGMRTKKPYDFQKQIIKKAVAEFKEHDRTIIAMACGSGKTLTALWIAEAMKARVTAIFAPTLGLLSQLAAEWLVNIRDKNVMSIAVCSDEKMPESIDVIRRSDEEYLFRVTLDVKEIQDYMDAYFDGVKLIFCTYQSSDLLCSAVRKNDRIDFGVFDEAHRTAGKIGSLFSSVLRNERIFIKKRLFMTATPRVYTRGPLSALELVYSMDDERHYGKICAQLSFSKAIALGIICDYKVVVSAITSGALSPENMEGQPVENVTMDARTIAIRESMVKAVEKYGVKKIISYHATIDKAHEFAFYEKDGFLPHFEKCHVSSEQSSETRNENLRRFERSSHAILTNARCLTEGIDVPAADMVAIVDPKGSEIDVAQIIGRVLRTAEGKTIGYIFVPLFLDIPSGETGAEAVRRSGYQTVWDVVKALYAIDENFRLKASAWRQKIGGGKPFGGIDFINFGIDYISDGIDPNVIKEGVDIFIAEEFGDVWDLHYGELVKFNMENGHINAPTSHFLWVWMKTQRRYWKNGRLTERQKGLLLKLGFDPYPFETRELRILEKLRKYFTEHGHCNVPHKKDIDLSKWLAEQRHKHSSGNLNPSLEEKLEEMNINWGNSDYRFFTESIRKYKAIRERDGKAPDHASKDRESKNLATYITKLRNLHKQGKLSLKKREALKDAGIILDPLWEQWLSKYRELVRLKGLNYDPNDLPDAYEKLREWIKYNLKCYRAGRLEMRKIDRFVALGIVLDKKAETDKKWKARFNIVKKYFEDHGTDRLPVEHDEYEWWRSQLRALKDGNLSEWKIPVVLSLLTDLAGKHVQRGRRGRSR
jgi:superfamily II DNA or RNA helicase